MSGNAEVAPPAGGATLDRIRWTRSGVPPVPVTRLVAPPPPPFLVERPRLTDRLRDGLAGPVTVLHAPAGAGKTTLLGCLARTSPMPVAWVSADPHPHDATGLWRAVADALRRAGAGGALASLEPSPAFAPRLLNALAGQSTPVALVIDDLQLVRSQSCLEQLELLVRHPADQLRLVLASRTAPDLPLHALRAAGRLTELGRDDLAFTEDEARALLRAHGVALERDNVARLHARSEGWAAGLRLAALALQRAEGAGRVVDGFTGEDRIVGDYLAAEVLDRRPARERDFLLRTSVADVLTPDLARELTGLDASGALLEALARETGFVVRVGERPDVFRHHALFAGLLRARARLTLGEELPALRGRAARWHSARGDAARALRDAVCAGDPELVAHVVCAHWLELFVAGERRLLRDALDGLDAPPADAGLDAARACLAFDAGDATAAARHLAAAPAGDRTGSAFARLRGAVLADDPGPAFAGAARGLAAARGRRSAPPARRDVVLDAGTGSAALWAGALGDARRLLARAVAAGGDDAVTVAARADLALTRLLLEGPASARDDADAALLQAARTGRQPPAAALAALAAAELGELRPQRAEEHLHRAAAAAAGQWCRPLEVLLVRLGCLVDLTLGRTTDGLARLDAFLALHDTGRGPAHERATLACVRARLHEARNDPEAGLAALRAAAPEPAGEAQVVAARLQVAAGEPGLARDMLLAPRADPVRVDIAVERDVVLAVALDVGGDERGSASALERALDRAEDSGHRWAFAAAGRRAVPLLRRATRVGTAHRALAGELLDDLTGEGGDRRPVAAPALDRLSEREQVVLRYLPTSLSNREIADELFVSTNTIKTHIRSIYRKLDVGRRGEAVARARELRLLAAPRR